MGTIGVAKAKGQEANHLGLAWVMLCLVFAAHVVDEALTDFLSVYNPTVRAIRHSPFAHFYLRDLADWFDDSCNLAHDSFTIRLFKGEVGKTTVLPIRVNHAWEWSASHHRVILPGAVDARCLYSPIVVGQFGLLAPVSAPRWKGKLMHQDRA
jgi:hypothetical protein